MHVYYINCNPEKHRLLSKISVYILRAVEMIEFFLII